MKATFTLVLALLAGTGIALGQSKPAGTKLHKPEFNLTIHIPDGFERVSTEEWAKFQNKGKAAIENTTGAEIENRSKTLFVFRNGNFNYLESNYQPFNVSTDGDYAASCKATSQLLYKTFESQIPNVQLDSATTTQVIDQLSFRRFDINMTLPNGMVLRSSLYNRLFGNRDFTVSIMYVDEKQGQLMHNAWQGATFNK